MTPKQINELKYTATVIAGILICIALTWVAVEFHKHKSAHKLTNHAIIHQNFK